MANERTFAAWFRTGLAAIAVGVAFQRLFGEARPGWVVQVGATVLLATGAVIFVWAAISYRRTARRLERHTAGPSPKMLIYFLTGMAILATAIVGAILWFL